MPTDEENVQYLYLVLTHGGMPTVDWDKVSEELDLKRGATTKRWSRLKAAIAEGKNAGPSAATFLWYLVKHSARDKAMDWNDIAEKCGTTAGAASKRWYRLKQSIENGDGPPAPAAKEKADNEKKSPAKKRAPKKASNDKVIDDDIKNEGDDEGEEEKPKPKKSTPKKRAPKAVKDVDPKVAGENDEPPKKRSRASKKTAAATKDEPSATLNVAINATSASEVIVKKDPAATAGGATAGGEDDGGIHFDEANDQIQKEVAEITKDQADSEAEIII